jgi:hypothetical protein
MFAINRSYSPIFPHFRWMFRRWDRILVEVTYAVIPGTVGSVPVVTEKGCMKQSWRKKITPKTEKVLKNSCFEVVLF